MPIGEYDLSGRVAFVTGAGRGIGKGIAQVLAEAGADVVINSLTDRYVTPLAAEIARATGRRVVPLVADVTKSEEVDRAVARILEQFAAAVATALDKNGAGSGERAAPHERR